MSAIPYLIDPALTARIARLPELAMAGIKAQVAVRQGGPDPQPDLPKRRIAYKL